MIEFEKCRTLEEAIRKAKYCYDQNKRKNYFHKSWKDKKNEKFDQRTKGFKPSHLRNKKRKPSQTVTKPARMMGNKP